MLRGRGNNGKNRQRGGAVDAKSCRFGSGLVRFSIRFRAPGTGTGSFYWCKGFLAKDILKSKGMAYRSVRRGGGAGVVAHEVVAHEVVAHEVVAHEVAENSGRT